MVIELNTPIAQESIDQLQVGDQIQISGFILCGRDAVLPKMVRLAEEGAIGQIGVNLEGGVIFHTAVSPAGVGPTSSNKFQIESSIGPLSRAGIKIHLGKGQIQKETIEALNQARSVYAVLPPVTALLKEKTKEQRIVAFSEEGMEALYMLKVDCYPAIIAAAHGRSIYE